MVIDIIDLTDDAYADLTGVQLAMVNAAQVRKNAILAAAAEQLGKQFHPLINIHPRSLLSLIFIA